MNNEGPKKPFVNMDELEDWVEHGEGLYAGERYAGISEKIGAVRLSYSVTVVQPGKRVCPFHNHRINEELFLVLEGYGTLRFGDMEYPIKKNDVIACPPGDRSVAHQILNTSDAELKYFCLSTNDPFEIGEFPDSNKVSVYTAAERGFAKLSQNFRADQAVEYMDREEQ